MSIATVGGLAQELQVSGLLDDEQLSKVRELQANCGDPASLAQDLVQRKWITAFQANRLLTGEAKSLTVGQYVLLDQLGEGGMGQVFKARHTIMKREVAIKVIRKDRVASDDTVRRFHREIQAAARLTHPNIVRAFDADQLGDLHYFVMEYVEGSDLADVIKTRSPLPPGTACEFVRQAATGLQHAHEHGLVHRDIKPSNLLLTAKGNVIKVLDMGLARLSGPLGAEGAATALTSEGVVMGTPDYIAPEQVQDARSADIRADVYSLGCTLYHLVAGRPPFPHGSVGQKLAWHVCAEPEPIESLRADLPVGLGDVVRKMMAKRPEDRYSTPAAVADALAPFAALGESSVSPAAMSPDAGGIAPTLDELPPATLDTHAPTRPEARREIIDDPGSRLPTTNDYQPKAGSGRDFRSPGDFGSPRGRRRWPRFAGIGGTVVAGLVVAIILANGPGSSNENRDGAKDDEDAPAEIVNSLKMKFVLIPRGTFTRGTAEHEIPRLSRLVGRDLREETPQHAATIPKGYYLGIHEITQAQYEQLMGEIPSQFSDKGKFKGKVAGDDVGALPVDSVTWHEAMEFCRRLSELPEEKKAGRVYRLPTEAEWECAARADGPEQLSEHAWFANNAGGRTRPVGSLKANHLGIHDLHGNVAEWCLDWYGAYPLESVDDPTGPAQGDSRVVRGGYWASPPLLCRAACRSANIPDEKSPAIGFRVVMDAGRITAPSAQRATPVDVNDSRFTWNPEIRDQLVKVFDTGMDTPASRTLYELFSAYLERGAGVIWCIGEGMTRDGNNYKLELKNDKLLSEVLAPAEARRAKLERSGLALYKVKGSESVRMPERPAAHPGQLLRLSDAHVWARLESDGALYLFGRVRCDTPPGPAIPAVDLVLAVEQRAFKGESSWTTIAFHPFSMTRLPNGWLTLALRLPPHADLPGDSDPRKPVLDGRLVLRVDGFLFQPAPRKYQVSNELIVMLQRDETGTLRAQADPDEQDGWNRKVRSTIESVLAKGVSDSRGRTLYAAIQSLRERGKAGYWRIGNSLTVNGMACMVFLSADRGLTTNWLTPEQATEKKIDATTFQLAYWTTTPQVIQLVKMQEAEIRVVTEPSGKQFLTGRVRCARTAQMPMEDLSLVFELVYENEGPSAALGQYKSTQLFVPLKEVPTGWMTFRREIDAGKKLAPRGRLLLKGFVTWPKPDFYQLSNDVPFLLVDRK